MWLMYDPYRQNTDTKSVNKPFIPTNAPLFTEEYNHEPGILEYLANYIAASTMNQNTWVDEMDRMELKRHEQKVPFIADLDDVLNISELDLVEKNKSLETVLLNDRTMLMSVQEKLRVLQGILVKFLKSGVETISQFQIYNKDTTAFSDFVKDIMTISLSFDSPGSQLCGQLYPLQNTGSRYDHLGQYRVFIAMNLFNNEDVLPDFLHQFMFFISKLDYKHCFISIYENGSSDNTKAFLSLLKLFLTAMQIPHAIHSTNISKPKDVHRIAYLANVRNEALKPFWEHPEREKFLRVVFLNDVYFCAEDFWELLYQSVGQDADMTCGLDYDRGDSHHGPGFYDSWIDRDLQGHPFSKWPFDNFIRNSYARRLLQSGKPFQVACCWNGGAILHPGPFLNHSIRFRMARVEENECSASECSLVCKDFAQSGYDRFLVIPRVKVAYDLRTWKRVMELKASNPVYMNYPNDSLSEKVLEWRELPDWVACLGMLGKGLRSPDQPWRWERQPKGVSRHGEVARKEGIIGSGNASVRDLGAEVLYV